MAGKTQNRMELRRQYEAAEPLDPMEDETEEVAEVDDDDDAERRVKRRPRPAKAKAKSTKPVKPAARMRIVWKVVNDAFKEVATFEYSQKQAAETRAAELTARGKGTHFVQKAKEAMPENAPGLGANVPRSELAAPIAPKIIQAVADSDEDIEDEDDFEEAEAEAEAEDEDEED